MLIVVTVLVWQWQMVVARSMLLGGAVYLLPQTWFAWQAFRFQGARSAFSMVRAFYRGEAGKYILTAALFAVVFATVRPLDVPAMFGAYIGLMVINVVMTAARAHR
jgi:ATP synthase protein I